MKVLYKYSEDFGRMGDLDGVFITTKEIMDRMMEYGTVHLGEALGKHSEITADINDTTIEVITEDPAVIEIVEKHGLESGTDVLGCFLDHEADRNWTPEDDQ